MSPGSESDSVEACRVCGGSDLYFLFEVGPSILERCRACGLVQVRERPTEAELEAIYSSAYFSGKKYEDTANQGREERYRLSLLAKAGLVPGSRVLDVGCATGDFIAEAEGRYELWGIDIAESAVALARQRTPSAADRIVAGPVESQRFKPEFFDAIVLWDVLEHLWDPVAALERLLQYLRPGGLLVLSTPDIGALTARLMKRRWAFMTPPEHLCFFNEESLETLLEVRLGLELMRSTSRGKWVNLAFLFYKLKRVFPGWLPSSLIRVVGNSPLSRLSLYVPTFDIQYVVAQRRGGRAG